jgi:hypothetical protein
MAVTNLEFIAVQTVRKVASNRPCVEFSFSAHIFSVEVQ